MSIWYIKQKPLLLKSYNAKMHIFPSAALYLELNMPGGSLWVTNRKDASPFISLESARRALKLAKRHDKNIVIVRVDRRGSTS